MRGSPELFPVTVSPIDAPASGSKLPPRR